jgi:adenylate kinase
MTTDLIIFGPPGSGKGTQAPALAAARGIPHIATGDMLREHRSRGTELGSRADAYMQAGELVPDELVVAMLADRIAQPDAADGFVLDGFPRNVAQADALDRMLEAAGRVIDALVVLEVPEEEIVRRISGRLVSSSGRVYHELYNPPRVPGVDDVDGSPLLRRADDEPETVRTRYRTVYLAETQPVREHYRAAGVPELVVDGVGTPAEIAERIGTVLASARPGGSPA